MRNLVKISPEEDETSQRRSPYGIAFGRGFGHVTDSIEFVRDCPNLPQTQR